MDRDILFTLPPGFSVGGRREYCPECAEIWGLLSWYPDLKEHLEIHPVGFDRPRQAMVDLLGPAHQNAPTLVVAAPSDDVPDSIIQYANGLAFINNARDMGRYFAHRHGTPWPRD